MNYIDLLSDSDDDIPLIPSSHRSSTNNSGFAIQDGGGKAKSKTIFKTAHQCNPVNLLTSSDDDEPILKRPRQFSFVQKSPLKYGENSKCLQQDDINTDDYPSDHTEKYSDDVLSDHTEKYGSSDKDSLPDISLDDIPPPDADHLNSEYTDGYHDTDLDNIAGSDRMYDNASDNHPPRSIAAVRSNSSPAKSVYALNAAAKTQLPTTSVTTNPTSRHATKYSSSTSCDNDPYTRIKPTVNKPSTATNDRAQKASEKAVERERVKEEKKLAQQKKQEEKERKALDKKRDIAMRNAEREARRAAQPGECHRHMLLEIDRRFQNNTLGVCIEAICVANCVPMRYVDSLMSNTIVFKRKLVSPETGTTSHIQEDIVAVIVPMSDMVDMVLASVNSGSPHLSLEAYLKRLHEIYNSKPTLVSLGVEKYFRTVKTQTNRVYRDNVLGTQNNSKKNKEISIVTRLQYEETVTALQMSTNTVVINHELEEDVAKTILRMNKSIAEAPVKRDKYEQQAMSVRTTGLKIGKDHQGSLQVWQRMLQEFRNISADVAAAIVNYWPSPYMLFKEYEQRGSIEAERLLEDIEIRRGGGVVQTSRRVGKETSRRVYELFTKNADFIIK